MKDCDQVVDRRYRKFPGFLDEAGLLKQWPKRNALREAARFFLWSKFDADLEYTEREVNELLHRHHSFEDPAMLRRELFDWGLLDRRLDGSKYTKRTADVPEELRLLLGLAPTA